MLQKQEDAQFEQMLTTADWADWSRQTGLTGERVWRTWPVTRPQRVSPSLAISILQLFLVIIMVTEDFVIENGRGWMAVKTSYIRDMWATELILEFYVLLTMLYGDVHSSSSFGRLNKFYIIIYTYSSFSKKLLNIFF